MSNQRSCPKCGGRDRFYLVANPRNGGTPFWICNQCRYYESSGDHDGQRPPARSLTSTEQAHAQRGYAAVADWCAQELWTSNGHAALDYLHQRGLTDDTIHRAKLGYHPDTFSGGAGAAIWARDKDAYDGAQLGGILGPQGKPKGMLRGSITLPYYHNNTCTLIRSRKLAPGPGPKYLSPAGVPLYLGGTPTLYLADILSDIDDKGGIILTEGEFKALLSWQSGMPAVAQPGGGYLPDAYLTALAGKTVMICYDTEERTDPFVLSPGEGFTLRSVERLTGIGISNQISSVYAAIKDLKEKKESVPESQTLILTKIDALQNQVILLRERIDLLQSLRISVKVLRLPRGNERKMDLDSFILKAGADALKSLMSQAMDAEEWYAAHHGGGYAFKKGGIVGDEGCVANYQARITETIHQCDGMHTTALQRVALRTPSGRRVSIDIDDETWADDRAARTAIRVGLREGTFDDNPRDVLRAIRLLSAHGDPPSERSMYTCTGWEKIDGRWHFLVSDGAIHATGTTDTFRAEIDPEAVGNHYHMCGAGDAQAGAAAWLRFLRGEICPQPLALILAAQAALPLVHRFTGNAARTMPWIYHETGSLKTAVVRAGVMALFGPAFTAERADGAPVPKWDATSIGLSLLTFYYRDLAILIDDYKMGMIDPGQFKRFLHNYSEGTGRTRATKGQKIDRMKPARGIVFSTAEDVPGGDPGMQARLMAMVLKPESVDSDALARLQRSGVDGHLVAFWRHFIQTLAGELDKTGDTGLRNHIQNAIRDDDEKLPGHKRTAGTLRQNRAAFLVLTRWLLTAGYIRQADHDQFNLAHLEARSLLADVLEMRQKESRPSTIFLSVLQELLSSGELVIEQESMHCPKCGGELAASSDGWYCHGTVGDRDIPCGYHLSTNRIVGFRCSDGIGIFANKAFREVSRIRNDQRQPFSYSSTAIWQQIDADGLLAAKGTKGEHQVVRRNPADRSHSDGRGKPKSVLLLKAEALEMSDSEDQLGIDEKKIRSARSARSAPDLAHSNGAGGNYENLIRPDPHLIRNGFSDEKFILCVEADQVDRAGSDRSDPLFSSSQCSKTGADQADQVFYQYHQCLESESSPRIVQGAGRMRVDDALKIRRDRISHARALLKMHGTAMEIASVDISGMTDEQRAAFIEQLERRKTCEH